MNDQPKPTGDPIPCKAGQGFIHWKQRHADKCLICHPQPKSTGEWTARAIAKCYDIDSITATRLAFEFNAAERELRKRWEHKIEETYSILASERAKVAPPVDNKFVAEGCVKFGEPVKAEAIVIMNRSLMIEIQQLREELDAEREKVQTYEGALKEASEDLTCPSANETHYCPNCDNSLYNAKAKIDAALAKVKEGK